MEAHYSARGTVLRIAKAKDVMPPLNYTTKIAAQKTVQEIDTILIKHGARNISTDYENGEPEAVTFTMMVRDTPVSFRLPSNWRGLQRLLVRERVAPSLRTEAQARRVAWRIIKDWIEAQFALVTAEQATLQQIMLPYAVHSDGRTLYEHFTERTDRMLGSGEYYEPRPHSDTA